MNQDTQFNSHRRKLLQTAVGFTAVCAAGTTSLVLANQISKRPLNSKVSSCSLPTCDLSIYQLQSGTRELVTIMNQTSETVTIDEIYPVGLSQANGPLIVKVRIPKGSVNLKPGERLTFSIEAHTGDTRWGLDDEILPNLVAGNARAIPNVIAGKIKVKSQHPAFNGVIPVTVFDAVRA